MAVVSYGVPTSNHNRMMGRNSVKAVVSYGVPTSNHNLDIHVGHLVRLFLMVFLHQTTTYQFFHLYWVLLFLMVFLHQTTTLMN